MTASGGRAGRRRSLADALDGLSDDDFWGTRSAPPGHSPVARFVEAPDPTPAPDERRARPREAERPAPRARDTGGREVAAAGEGGGPPLLRPRNTRRRVATGRIAVRVPLEVMHRFNAVARLRREPRGVLFERVVTGFLDRLDRDGVRLITELHEELGLGRDLVVEEDVWTITGDVTFAADTARSAEPMVQMAHAVDVEVARRFDDGAWMLQSAKDTLGRLAITAFLWRFISQRPDLEPVLGFSAADVRVSASTSFR